MGKLINLDDVRETNNYINEVETASTDDIKEKTIDYCVQNIHDQLANLLNAKSQIQLAVNTIYQKFKNDGMPEVELDMQTHDINITISDIDTSEGNINNFLDFVRDTRKKV